MSLICREYIGRSVVVYLRQDYTKEPESTVGIFRGIESDVHGRPTMVFVRGEAMKLASDLPDHLIAIPWDNIEQISFDREMYEVVDADGDLLNGCWG